MKTTTPSLGSRLHQMKVASAMNTKAATMVKTKEARTAMMKKATTASMTKATTATSMTTKAITVLLFNPLSTPIFYSILLRALTTRPPASVT